MRFGAIFKMLECYGDVRCIHVSYVAVRPRCSSVRCPEISNSTLRSCAVINPTVRCGAVRCGAVRCGAVRFLLSYFATVWGQFPSKKVKNRVISTIDRMNAPYKTAVSQGSLVFLVFTDIIIIEIQSSFEIEYSVEPYPCKLCVIIRSRVLRVVCLP